MKKITPQIVVIGGGAAGFFSAINIAEKLPHAQITIVEKAARTLEKVKISGGGRCNVTHACFDVKELCKNYPRGSRELIAPFTRFQPADTIEWFKQRGVRLKAEPDGRMFPTTDNSQTIVDCLTQTAQKAGVAIKTQVGVATISYMPPPNHSDVHSPFWQLNTGTEQAIMANAIVVATGSSPRFWEVLQKLPIELVPPVPSLFTFNTKDKIFFDLSGVALPSVTLHVEGNTQLTTSGPMLITHWGLSGPAVLRLSAWEARFFSEKKYNFTLQINFTGSLNGQTVEAQLRQNKQDLAKKQVLANSCFAIPTRLWRRLIEHILPNPDINWADISNKQIDAITNLLTRYKCNITGKSTFKEEFVTCGGVKLSEVDFKTMESKQYKHLFFAGEVLDIDALTGGFNFQAAWTTAFIAAQSIGDIFCEK